MKSTYIEIMEKALIAYTPECIRDYIDSVKENGLSEHGFPRLGANIGILLSCGRRTDLYDTFIEIMDLYCAGMHRRGVANDFSIREVCCALMRLEEKGTVPSHLLRRWKEQISSFDPWKHYDVIDDHSGKFVGNWALFSAVSEYARGVYCGIDTSEFVEWQLPSQIRNLDHMGLYRDSPGHDCPMLYDLIARLLFAFLLRFGYNGKYRDVIEKMLDDVADPTLMMQSVTGEIPFGGRSNQFLFNDTTLCSFLELEALRSNEKGDPLKAGEFRAAAELAADCALRYLSRDHISHIKNGYDTSSMMGCEGYAYFNKYMTTTASNIYMGALFCDDTIEKTELTNKKRPYVFSTGEYFHKTFVSAGGYFLEFDTAADPHYDGSGLGRVHKEGCPSEICLSVPFPPDGAGYKLEIPAASPMSLSCKGGAGAVYTLTESSTDDDTAKVTFACDFGREEYTVSQTGVEVYYGQCGFTIPVFEFDGETFTEISTSENEISVRYRGAVCTYSFNGEIEGHENRFNRNGRYRVYSVSGDRLFIRIEKQADSTK